MIFQNFLLSYSSPFTIIKKNHLHFFPLETRTNSLEHYGHCYIVYLLKKIISPPSSEKVLWHVPARHIILFWWLRRSFDELTLYFLWDMNRSFMIKMFGDGFTAIVFKVCFICNCPTFVKRSQTFYLTTILNGTSDLRFKTTSWNIKKHFHENSVKYEHLQHKVKTFIKPSPICHNLKNNNSTESAPIDKLLIWRN